MTDQEKPPEYKKLDPVFKVQWLEALRSGKYEQATMNLVGHSKTTLCCIGVGFSVNNPAIDMDDYADRHGEDNDQTDEAAADIGLDKPACKHLVGMNDDYGKSFAEIADWIDANL